MFVNFSNHPSESWESKQMQEALRLGGSVIDYPFPQVSAAMKEAEILEMADKITSEILQLHPDYVMAQGEFTLTYAVIRRLKEHNIPVLAASSERNVMETVEDGKRKKIVSFEFVQFREYKE